MLLLLLVSSIDSDGEEIYKIPLDIVTVMAGDHSSSRLLHNWVPDGSMPEIVQYQDSRYKTV